MAESIMRCEIKRRGLDGVLAVSSAGLFVKTGEPMNAEAKVVLKAMGIAPHRHKARVLTETLLRRAALVVCMTAEHKQRVISAVSLPEGRIVTVAEITGGNDIADPFGLGEDAYRRVAEYLLYAADDVITTVLK